MLGEKRTKYLLILKDDFYGYMWPVEATYAKAKAVGEAMLKRFATFGVLRMGYPTSGQISVKKSSDYFVNLPSLLIISP